MTHSKDKHLLGTTPAYGGGLSSRRVVSLLLCVSVLRPEINFRAYIAKINYLQSKNHKGDVF